MNQNREGIFKVVLRKDAAIYRGYTRTHFNNYIFEEGLSFSMLSNGDRSAFAIDQMPALAALDGC